MHFGAFMEFGNRAGVSESQAFQEGFRMVDAAEEMGLDGVWLAELHFNPARSVLSSPIVVASSIATRTKRLRVGMATANCMAVDRPRMPPPMIAMSYGLDSIYRSFLSRKSLFSSKGSCDDVAPGEGAFST